jgi:hypothetical protein
MRWVWLIFDDDRGHVPTVRGEQALLVSLLVKRLICVEIAAAIRGAELKDGLGLLRCPAHTGALHPVLDEIFGRFRLLRG